MFASLKSWVRRLASTLTRPGRGPERPSRCRRAHRPTLERLEDRTLLSGTPLTPLTLIAPTGIFAESISQAGEVDAFQVTVPADGLLTIQTHSEAGTLLHTRLSLYGPDPGGPLLAQSDGQSPTNLDALLAQHLQAGAYAIQVQVLAGTGAYTLTTDFSSAIPPFQSLPTGTVSAKVAAGDLNGDGIPDLVVGDYFNSDLVLMFGRGDGTFQDGGSVPVDGPPTSVVIGDFNGDGIPDLATANQTDLSVSVLLGNGNGTFRTPIRTPISILPFDLVAKDLNGDGRLDLVATSTTSNDVTVLLGSSKRDGTFDVKGSFTVGFGNSGVVAADLNGDGIPDLVTSNFLSHNISVLLGNGDGSFAQAKTIDLGTITLPSGEVVERLPSGVVAADFNGDGIPDLAISDFTTNDVSVLLGKGDGTFRDPERWAVGPNPNDIVAADFNGDGIVDLATPNFGTNDVSVLLGKGDGTFRDVGKRFGVGTTPYSLIAADFNRDGRPDLATVNIVSRDVSVLTGLGDGTFLEEPQQAIATSPSVVVTADFNHDGIPDLAAADFGSSDVAVLLGRGDGTFQNQMRFPTGANGVNPLSLTFGDFNGDGILDLATANVSSYSVSVLLGNGDGTFQPAQSYPVGISPFAVAAGDFNGDGHLDLVAANRASGDISVLLGKGDGTFLDQVRFAVDPAVPGAAPMALAVGDFDRDGKLDVATADFGLGKVSILRGNGDGSFTFENTFKVGKGPIFLIADDFNGDNVLDLAVSNNLSDTATGPTDPGTVSVLLGNGDGTFQDQIVLPAGVQPRSLLAGDFNHDGKRDLAVANLGARTATQSGGVSVFLGTVKADGTFTFLPAAGSPFPAGPGLWGLAAADFNRDGNRDLAATNITANSVTVLQGNGHGTFTPQGHFAVGTGPVPLATADFNRDGRPDVARADYNAGTVTVLLGGGAGALQQSASVVVGQGPIAVVAADLNGDRRPDLVTANYLAGTVSVLFGLGDGTFETPKSFPAGPTPSALAVGDFNGDGRPDIAVTNDQAGTVTLLFGQADGGFGAARSFTVGQHPDAIVAGDFNGDGKLDLAVANYGSKSIQVLLGNGDGTFTPQAPIDVGAGPVALIAGDFDGDRRVDLAAANYATNEVTILWGRGDGTFTPQLPIDVGAGPVALIAGDFNGDGGVDLATANNVSGDVSLLVHQGGRQFALAATISVGDFPYALAAADFNGDGRLDLAVATQLSTTVSVLVGQGGGSFFPAGAIAAPVQSTPLVADLNGDGLADVTVLSRDGRILYRQARPGPEGGFAAPVVINPSPDPAARDLALIETRSGTNNGRWLAALDATDGRLSFYIPQPDGTFSWMPGPRVPGFLPAALVAGDLNGDGLSDLVVTAAGSGQVFIYLQSTDPGAGTFSPLFGPPAYESEVGAGPTSLTLADMDGDGRLDVVVTDQLSGDVSVLLNVPGRPFAAATRFRAGPGPYGMEQLAGTTVVRSQLGTAGVVAGRFDGDNNAIDLIVTNSAMDSFSLLKGDGFGGVFDPVNAPAFTTGLGPTAVVAGLLDGDAFPDLAVLEAGGSTVSIFLGDGKGGFTRWATVDAGNRPTGLTLADINGDGNLDLVIGNEFGDVLQLLGDGHGTFAPYRRVGQNIALAVADLNGDGKPDFVFGNEALDQVTVQYSQPGPTFTQGRGDGVLAPGAVATADLNGDGIPDLIVVNSGANAVLVYLGLGNGRFGPAREWSVGTDPVGVTVANLNGLPDLLVANEGSNDVSVLLGQGSGAAWTLTPGPRLQAGGLGPVSTTVADVTGPQGAADGIPDLLVVNSQSNTVAVLPGLGNGFFDDSHPQLLKTGRDPRQVVTGNFDGRSAVELVTVNAGSNDLTFFSGLGAGVSVPTGGEGPVAAVAADLNGDGLTDLLVANNGSGQIMLLLGGPVLFQVIALDTLIHPSALALSADGFTLYVAVEGEEAVHTFLVDFTLGAVTLTLEDLGIAIVLPDFGSGVAVVHLSDLVDLRAPLLLATVGSVVTLSADERPIPAQPARRAEDPGAGSDDPEAPREQPPEERPPEVSDLITGVDEALRRLAEGTREEVLRERRDPPPEEEVEGEPEGRSAPLWPGRGGAEDAGPDDEAATALVPPAAALAPPGDTAGEAPAPVPAVGSREGERPLTEPGSAVAEYSPTGQGVEVAEGGDRPSATVESWWVESSPIRKSAEVVEMLMLSALALLAEEFATERPPPHGRSLRPAARERLGLADR